MEKLPFGVDKDAVTDKVGRGGSEMLTHDPAKRFGRKVQSLGVVGWRVQGAVILLDELTQLDENWMPKLCTRPACTGFRRLNSRCENEQDLQMSEHDFAVSEVALVVFLSDAVDQILHARLRLIVQHDHGDSVGVVEEDTTAPDLRVERLDAKKVGMELDDFRLYSRIGCEPDVLVRYKEQQRTRSE